MANGFDFKGQFTAAMQAKQKKWIPESKAFDLNPSGWANKFLPNYRTQLGDDPQKQQALAEAVKIVRANKLAMRNALPASQLAGGGDWADFDDYHAVRNQTEKLLGNKYSVGGISGGDDLNERPVSGMGQTRQINAPRGGGAFSGGGGFGAASQYDPRESESDHSDRLERSRLGLELLRQQLEQAGLQTRAMQMRGIREEAEPFAGSQAETDRQVGRTTRAFDLRELGEDMGASRAARRFNFPEVANQRAEEQRNALARASASAQTAGLSRERVAAMQTATQRAIAEGRRPDPSEIIGDWFESLSGTYGTDPRTGAAQLPPHVAALRDQMVGRGQQILTPQAGAGGDAGGGAAGAPRDGERRQSRNGVWAIYRANGPEGPGWYPE